MWYWSTPANSCQWLPVNILLYQQNKNLILFDLIPEIKDNFHYPYIIAIILGLVVLKTLDLFVPNHEHHHTEKNDNIKDE